jgi:formylglycine-generating enzyme required for sulfatase activity
MPTPNYQDDKTIIQWATRTITIPLPLATNYGVRPDLIPHILRILKAVNLIDPQTGDQQLTLDNLELLTTLLHKKAYDLSDLNAAIDHAIADGVGTANSWQFRGQWVLVIGTGVYELSQSMLLIAEALGKTLAGEGFGLITGSRPGVDHVVARSFAAQLQTQKITPAAYLKEVTVEGQQSDHNYGTAITVKKTEDWIPYTLKQASALVIIGGGILADSTYQSALRLNKPVLPIPITGGTATKAYEQLVRLPNYGISATSLNTLNGPLATPTQANTIAANIAVICREITAGNLSGKLASDNWTLTTGVLQTNTPVIYSDTAEKHGVYVNTRGEHTLALPARFKMGLYLVTNQFFNEFVLDGGYNTDTWWKNVAANLRRGFVRRDKKTPGPKDWGAQMPSKKTLHPVTGISYYEALAFCRWLQAKFPMDGWEWTIPSEDMWEYAARSVDGRIYPWGNEFQTGYCNSAETNIMTTTSVLEFPKGESPAGCFDMAGNVWEFVDGQTTMTLECILRGGSFKNNKQQIRSHLRLSGVHKAHRPDDFGFRCAQVPTQTTTTRGSRRGRS